MIKIELLKQPDQAVILRCTRADGTVTWQKQTRHAAHFVLHDLTHYAVETTLGYGRGFLGLVAEGWDVEDTTGKGARGPLPPEAVEVEQIVGLFDTERGSGVLWSVEELNQFSPRPLTTEDIRSIRSLRSSLSHQWSALAPGDKMELTFGRNDVLFGGR
jgi:hypothetical protein